MLLPVYRFEHGNVAYQTTPFSCQWDSGLNGVIFTTNKQIKKNYGVKKVGLVASKRAEVCLKGEVETFSQWASGEVYGIKLFDSQEDYESDNDSDACWGFYLDDKNYDFAAAVKDHFGVELQCNVKADKAA